MSTEAEQYLGMSMTYSLFEYAKENLETLLVNQPEAVEVVSDTKDICDTLKNTTIRGMLITFSNTNKSGRKSLSNA